MMVRSALVITAALLIAAPAAAQTNPPPGYADYTPLFNGRDLSGWRGRQPNYNPAEEAKLTKEELAEKQAKWNAERDAHWRVDTAKKEIVSDGQSPHLATVKDYGDFDLLVDWLMVSPNGDSGIYLRGIPQVQIWDPSNQRELRNGADKGSGALWNNRADSPGKFPLVKADKPVGEWNRLKIRMVGEKVWVWLNDQLTVDGQVMHNFFDKSGTVPVPARGPIELQTHGSEIRFRNIYLKELK